MGYLSNVQVADAFPEVVARAADLDKRYRHRPAPEILRGALQDAGRVALVSSFGADSVVLLHMLAITDRTRPVLFLDTEYLFTETLLYQQQLTERLGLRNLRIIRSDEIAAEDPDGSLHARDPDACCALRKVRPLEKALAGFDAWITGRKRFQSGRRAALDIFEADPATGRIKVNPLAHWSVEDVRAYIAAHRLPRHPLVARGYPSIGCAPCTSPVAEGEALRAGRWRNRGKDECGIHFLDGRTVRTGASL